MTVSELMARLAEYAPDAPVVLFPPFAPITGVAELEDGSIALIKDVRPT